MKLSKGARLWTYAKSIIPGGNQILSKRPERFLPFHWPSYYERASGCKLWDLDGKEYFDFAQMGVGSCVLGYADPDVNRAVIRCIKKGSMSSLNCKEEVLLTKELIKLHPWAKMARYTRSGGEACAVAIRIARAATGRSNIVFCGYHGWHDWYLSANISNKENLSDQLLPGLKPSGVPCQLAKTAIPFHFNNIIELQKIFRKYKNEIAAVIIEPARSFLPKKNFLMEVKKEAKKNGALLIFDEITSGFRVCNGGLHLKLNINPDLCILGKALGNGFPISAVIGTKQAMENAQNSFISSTFWSERIGFTAALATIKKFKEEKADRKLISYGRSIKHGIENIGRRTGLKVTVEGIEPLLKIKFHAGRPNEYQTFYAGEMLKNGFLVGGNIYTSLAYNDRIIKNFLIQSEKVFLQISKVIKSKKPLIKNKKNIISQDFKRLN